MKRFSFVGIIMLLCTLMSCSDGSSSTVLTGTGTTTGNQTAATATPQPLTLAPITTLTIPGTDIYEPIPTADGFIFVKTQKNPGPTIGTLYHYVVATKHLTVLDTATPDAQGENRDIRLPTVAGNTIAYIKSTNNLTSWEFWTLNLITGQKTLLGSDQKTIGIQGQYPNNFAMDATHIVWSTFARQNGHLGSYMQVYSLADHTSTTILRDFTSTPPTIFRPAVQGSTITYTKLPYGVATTTGESIWRINLDGTNQQQIAPTGTANVNITLSDAYVAWDELTNEDRHDTTRVFDLATNQEVKLPYNTCIRPTLNHQFLTCIDLITSSGGYIFNLETGRWANFAQGQSIQVISLTDDRIFWSNTDVFDAEWMAYPN